MSSVREESADEPQKAQPYSGGAACSFPGGLGDVAVSTRQDNHHGSEGKEIRPVAERLITWAKTDDLHNRRLAATYVMDPAALQRLFGEIGPANIDRPGGYTRIIKLGQRRGDGAAMAIIELVDMPGSSVRAGSAKAKK